MEAEIRGSSWNPYSQDHQEDLLYDFDQARSDIQQWKAHILCSINQDEAKQDALKIEDSSSALIVMDWAMKFLQLKYREKQSDWYGKRGLSWHISTVISFNASSGSLQLKSYAHLFDSCQQDWFAVCSVIENLLKVVKNENPAINSVYLRSDGAGCYHNNSLIAAVRDVGERAVVRVLRYDFSEPQHGKDVCDRILCPMKASIRRYCNEGHDIITADDMRTALSERNVRGTSACVCLVDASKKHWKNSQISKFDQTWISIGFLNIQVNQIPKFGFKLDKSWIFHTRINKPVKPKLVFKKITIKLVYHKT